MNYIYPKRKHKRFYSKDKSHYLTYNDSMKSFDLIHSETGGIPFFGIPYSDFYKSLNIMNKKHKL